MVMVPLKAFLTLLVISNLITLIVLNIATRSRREVILTEGFLTNDKIENQGTLATNPLVLLGAYPEFNLNDHVLTKGTKYHWNLWGIYHDPQYCQKVDAYNLAHPENMFKNMNFFTDFPKGSLPRVKAMEKMVGGKVFPKLARTTTDKIRKFELSHEITNFFTETNLYTYFHVSKHFLCATQIGNHIPGVGYLVRKTEVIQKTKLFAQKYENQPQCFNKNEFFLPSYRLYNEKECKEFFDLINTQAYKESLEKEPIQYLIKVGVGAHKSEGVFLLDENKTQSINQEYDFGLNCGKTGGNLIAQKYITNPLLLDMDNKFDFRIFMLIASTNPKIVYYHDGYLRVAVNTFDKSSKDRATHLTNTAVAKKVFAKVKGNETVNGMNLAELKDYHLWYLSDLQDYLLEIGKITDKNWLDNYLRPAFQKVMVHLIRMTGEHFYKGSNVYELHGLDFMLDNDLNLWFIEDNSSPLLIGVKPDLMSRMLMDAYEIEYALYRSRMKRVLEVVNKLQTKLKNKEAVDYENLKEEYQRAIKNRLEPEYQISKENTFVPILDETLPGSDSLLGHLPPECL